MQSGLPADAASLRETGSVDRLHRMGPWPVGVWAAVYCEVSMSHYALADGAEGLHFSAI